MGSLLLRDSTVALPLDPGIKNDRNGNNLAGFQARFELNLDKTAVHVRTIYPLIFAKYSNFFGGEGSIFISFGGDQHIFCFFAVI